MDEYEMILIPCSMFIIPLFNTPPGKGRYPYAEKEVMGWIGEKYYLILYAAY